MKARNIASNSTENSQFNRDIIKLAAKIEHLEGMSTREAISLWITIMAEALKAQTFNALSSVDPVYRKKFDEHEAKYLSHYKRLRHPKEVGEIVSEMMAKLVIAMEDRPGDMLGPLFMEAFSNARLGQFFTSTSLSDFIAQSTLPKTDEEIGDVPYITALEPACGVGGMVMSAHKILNERGIRASTRVVWTAVDIDKMAIDCAYIQMSLGGVSGIVVWGNTLSQEVFDSWPTITLVLTRPGLARSLLKIKKEEE